MDNRFISPLFVDLNKTIFNRILYSMKHWRTAVTTIPLDLWTCLQPNHSWPLTLSSLESYLALYNGERSRLKLPFMWDNHFFSGNVQYWNSSWSCWKSCILVMAFFPETYSDLVMIISFIISKPGTFISPLHIFTNLSELNWRSSENINIFWQLKISKHHVERMEQFLF